MSNILQVLEQLAGLAMLEQEVLEEHLDNLLVLLRQNPGWGIMLEEGEEVSLGLVRNISWACSVYKWGAQMMDMVWRLAWVIMGMLVSLLVLTGLYKMNAVRKARNKKKDEEVFQLVRQATNFLYQQHQMAAREGKGGPSYLAINHIRDQLIPPQDRLAKSALWGEVVEYIEKNESRSDDRGDDDDLLQGQARCAENIRRRFPSVAIVTSEHLVTGHLRHLVLHRHIQPPTRPSLPPPPPATPGPTCPPPRAQ